MLARKFNFTKKDIAEIPTPSGRNRIYRYDLKVRGLAVCVLPSGKKIFLVYRKINGRPERITIGSVNDFTIEQARGKASEINGAVSKGENPASKNRLAKEEATLGKLFDVYLERHAKVHKSSWKEDVRQFNCYLSSWKRKQLSTIRKIDIQKLHQEVGNNSGHYAANRLLSLLASLFNRANELGLWGKQNPAHGIKKFKEKSRSRFLQADELPRFFKALSEELNETARDYILMSLLSGARKANVLAMRWDQINLEIGIWTIPTTKNGDEHTIPLVTQALEILRNRYAIKQSDWVFPSTGKSGHLSDPKKAWERILMRAGITNLRLHDLRRSLGSWQASTGASLSIIGKTLAHRNVSTTAIYARLNIDPVREAMNKATQAMWEAGVVSDHENVVDIKKALS